MKHELKGLSNPEKYHNPISIINQDIDVLKNMLNAMLLIRKTEQLALGRKNVIIGGPPLRIVLPDATAPTSKVLEKAYYSSIDDVVRAVKKILNS